MHIRDKDIQKLVYYAKSLGAKVNIRNYAYDHEGETIFDTKHTINVNKRAHKNKTQIILTLLHELSHVKYVALNNYKFSNSFLEEIWALEEAGERIPKKYTKDIVEFETESLKLMTNIASELGLKIPAWKLLTQQAHDMYFYEHLGETGFFPTEEQSKKEWKRLKGIYKK